MLPTSLPVSECERTALWSEVPPVCSPHLSRLTPGLVSSHFLAVEAARQEKLRKKLERKVEVGAITEQEKQHQLEKVGRETEAGPLYRFEIFYYHSDSSDSFQLLGSDRGTRKRQQVENIAALLSQHQMETKRVVVDFGSGSGNLCLVLASFYKHSTFVFVDQNEKSLGKIHSLLFSQKIKTMNNI